MRRIPRRNRRHDPGDAVQVSPRARIGRGHAGRKHHGGSCRRAAIGQLAHEQGPAPPGRSFPFLCARKAGNSDHLEGRLRDARRTTGGKREARNPRKRQVENCTPSGCAFVAHSIRGPPWAARVSRAADEESFGKAGTQDACGPSPITRLRGADHPGRRSIRRIIRHCPVLTGT